MDIQNIVKYCQELQLLQLLLRTAQTYDEWTKLMGELQKIAVDCKKALYIQ